MLSRVDDDFGATVGLIDDGASDLVALCFCKFVNLTGHGNAQTVNAVTNCPFHFIAEILENDPPLGIEWHRITERDLEEMPILAELKALKSVRF